jgi:MFS family permease
MKDANNVEFVTTKVPPDGGYGWVVASAMALNSFIYIPLSSCFGLIFKDIFAELGLSAAEVSLIVNLHTAFGMLTGLLNGVLLKLFGYRKTAMLAAVLYFGGITSTSFARSFPFFIVAYGLVASLGLGMCKSSFSLALNTYFKKRRSKAIGFTVTVTGFGPIVLPQLITFLMKFYDPQGVMLIFGGLCAHFFVTALLLQPVKWHMKDENEQLTLEQKKSSQPDSVQDSCDACTDNASQESKSLLAKITNFFDLDLLQDGIFLNILLGLSLSLFVDMNFTLLTPFILNDLGLTTYQIATFISTLGAADIVFRFLAPYIGDYLKSTPRQIYVFTIIFTAVMRFGT